MSTVDWVIQFDVLPDDVLLEIFDFYMIMGFKMDSEGGKRTHTDEKTHNFTRITIQGCERQKPKGALGSGGMLVYRRNRDYICTSTPCL